jgi:hypothetical protein
MKPHPVVVRADTPIAVAADLLRAHLLAALETILGERFTTVRPLGVPSAGDAYEYGFPVPERDETAAEGTVD